MTKLLTVLASVCVVTACVAPAADDHEAALAETASEVARPADVGDDCVYITPITWTEGSATCRSFGNALVFASDGDVAVYQSFRGGVGTCTLTCTSGVIVRSDCTCAPR